MDVQLRTVVDDNATARQIYRRLKEAYDLPSTREFNKTFRQLCQLRLADFHRLSEYLRETRSLCQALEKHHPGKVPLDGFAYIALVINGLTPDYDEYVESWKREQETAQWREANIGRFERGLDLVEFRMTNGGLDRRPAYGR